MSKIDMTVSRAIADLAWAINSPSLIDSHHVESESAPSIGPNEVNHNHLLDFLDSNPTNRVGRYFETLVLYFLQHVQNYEIVASGQPIIVDRRTVGEIDFLYRDHAGVLTHLEVAVKFYLHLPGNPYNGSHFVGPNASDSFERKTCRMFEHQLPLSKIHHPEVDRRIAWMKGKIYYPPDDQTLADYPEFLSTDHQRGSWIYASEITQIDHWQADSFLAMDKPYWLTFDSEKKQLDRLQFQEAVQDHFTHSKFPMHVAIVRDGIEIERLFIVADSWPSNSSL